VDKTAIWFKSGGADMVSVLWSKSITCSEAGCTWNAMGADLKELLKQVEMHTREAHPPNMRKSTATMTVEENMKKELLRILECPVCLSEFKPPIQIYQCLEGHVICGTCIRRPEVGVCPQCRIVWKGNLSRNRVLETISRKLFPNEPVNTGNEQDVVSEKDVPEVPLRYPIYDDMGFPDYGLDMY